MTCENCPGIAHLMVSFAGGGSFGYFDDAGNRTFLEAAARTLRSGGRLIIDSPWMDSLLPMWQPRSWSRVGDSLLLEDRRFDSSTGRIESEWTIVRDGVESVRQASIRLYTVREMVELCRSVGFSQAGAVTETGDAYEFGATGRLFVATR